MKKLAIAAMLMLAVYLSAAHADDSHHPEKAQAAGQTAAPQDQGMGMMNMDRMSDVQQMMERIHKTADPKERQRLMQEHMQQMHQMMGDMHAMMGKGMGKSSGENRMMMEQRMDMMQGMMEQMMEHMMAQQEMANGGGKEKVEDKQHDHRQAK